MLPGMAQGLARAPEPSELLVPVSCHGWLPLVLCLGWQWLGMRGDGWGWAGIAGDRYLGGTGGSRLFSLLPHFSSVQKEEENTQ